MNEPPPIGLQWKRQSFWQKMNLFPLSQKSVITVWAIQSVWTVRILRSKLSEL